MVDEVAHINNFYEKEGFFGVIEYVEAELQLGRVTKKEDGLYKITTGGWSEDEELIYNLIDFLSFFRPHYVGYLCGGAYYFSEERYDNDWEIQKALSDKETCNPRICEVCEYSSNGKRDAARSITMCDGCRYNESFEHKTIQSKNNNGQIIVDKEKLREQLMSIIGTCSDCDMKHGIHCNKEACGYELSDKLIDEIINNCTVEEMEDD